MDYQLLQLAAVYAEDARVPRTAGPRRHSRSALSSFGSWIRRTIQRRRGYQRLQQAEDLTYLWLEDGPEEEPDMTIFEPPEDLLAPGDALSYGTSLLIPLEQPGDYLINLDVTLEPIQPRSRWSEESTPQPDHLMDEPVPSGLADPLIPVRTGACLWLPD